MKVIIAGSRDITDYNLVKNCIERSNFNITVVISGNARGVDKLGERWAIEKNIPVELHPVTSEEWKRIGKSAGHKRNERMAKLADALIAIWDGKSNGTMNMLHQAVNNNLFINFWDLSKHRLTTFNIGGKGYVEDYILNNNYEIKYN